MYEITIILFIYKLIPLIIIWFFTWKLLEKFIGKNTLKFGASLTIKVILFTGKKIVLLLNSLWATGKKTMVYLFRKIRLALFHLVKRLQN